MHEQTQSASAKPHVNNPETEDGSHAEFSDGLVPDSLLLSPVTSPTFLGTHP